MLYKNFAFFCQSSVYTADFEQLFFDWKVADTILCIHVCKTHSSKKP